MRVYHLRVIRPLSSESPANEWKIKTNQLIINGFMEIKCRHSVCSGHLVVRVCVSVFG